MKYNTNKYTVVNRIDLGFTRIAGYTLFNPADCSFRELTPGVVKNLIAMKQVNGLKMVNGEIALDPDFCQDNLVIKSGVGNYRLLVDMPDRPNDLMISLTKPITDPVTGENVYEVVTNRCARVCIHEEAMFKYLKQGIVAGCDYTVNENGEMQLIICDGVDVLDYHPANEGTGDLEEVLAAGNQTEPDKAEEPDPLDLPEMPWEPNPEQPESKEPQVSEEGAEQNPFDALCNAPETEATKEKPKPKKKKSSNKKDSNK